MPSDLSTDDRSQLQRLAEENRQLKAENQHLQTTVTRLELFNKIMEREVAELKSGPSETPKPVYKFKKKRVVKENGWLPKLLYVLVPIILIAGGYIWFSRYLNDRQQNYIRSTSVGKGGNAAVEFADTSSKATTVKKSSRTAKVSASAETPVANDSLESVNGKKYKVVTRAYFHSRPDDRTRRKAFITHWNNAVLTPVKDTGDYIYVVFTNHKGQTSRGWLRKDELTEVDE